MFDLLQPLYASRWCAILLSGLQSNFAARRCPEQHKSVNIGVLKTTDGTGIPYQPRMHLAALMQAGRLQV